MSLLGKAALFGVGYFVGQADKTRIKEKIVNGVSTVLLGEDAQTYWNKPWRQPKRRYYGSYYRDHKTYYTPYRSYPSYIFKNSETRRAVLDYVYETEDKANAVIDKMKDQIDSFCFVSINDLKDVIEDVTEDCFKKGLYDRDYGWMDISDAYVKPVVGGYQIVWPVDHSIEDFSDELEDEDVAKEEDT